MPQRRSEGQGSGFLIDASGYIVTNNHVAGGADEITVTLQDGRKFDATLVGSDPKTDLALIKVEASGLPYVAFGDSDKARVGDWVVAIGNPFGLGGTATAGIISARGRDIQSGPYDDYLQLDAPINFGNSGGPVFNVGRRSRRREHGDLLAERRQHRHRFRDSRPIRPRTSSRSSGRTAASSAVGSACRSRISTRSSRASLRLTDAEGALVADVVGDGPAARAGVQAGDVITRFNEHEIDSARTLEPRGGRGDAERAGAKVTVWRDGRSRELTVELGEAQNDAVAASTAAAAAPRKATRRSVSRCGR